MLLHEDCDVQGTLLQLVKSLVRCLMCLDHAQTGAIRSPAHTPGNGLLAMRLLSEDPMWLVPSLAFQCFLIFHANGSVASSSEPGGMGQQVGVRGWWEEGHVQLDMARAIRQATACGLLYMWCDIGDRVHPVLPESVGATEAVEKQASTALWLC
jgi:hypothetical protein